MNKSTRKLQSQYMEYLSLNLQKIQYYNLQNLRGNVLKKEEYAYIFAHFELTIQYN